MATKHTSTEGSARRRRRTPQQERSRALVDAVVQAAQELWSEPGRAAGMRRIATRAGVSVGSLYEYFADRESLVNALIDKTAVGNFRRLQRALDDEALAIDEVCDVIVREAAAIYLNSPQLTRAMLKAAYRFDRMPWVVKERDRFSLLLGARLHKAFPAAGRAPCEASAIAATEMLGGLVMSELYRTPDPARWRALTERMQRFIDAELVWLGSR